MARKPPRAVGLDFGTTNTSVARIAADGSVELVQFAATAGATPSFRSLLLFERDGKGGAHSFAGPSAIEQYLHAEEGQRRLIQSLKSYLSSRTLVSTDVWGRRYTVEDLLARMLREVRVEAERFFGSSIECAVVGRPVRFVGAATEEDGDYALDRLHSACLLAGFQQVRFEYEPVGAAAAYESTLDHEELVLIGDFGGGTSDFSLLRIGPGTPERGRVLGSEGVGVAGDAFDAKLVRHLVSPALGAGALERSGDKLLPAVPAWIYANLERWHYLSFLRTRNVAEILKGARVRALEPEKICALQALVEQDLGFQLHRAVQRVKYELSRVRDAVFHFSEGGLNLSIPVSREAFEGWIEDDLAGIEAAVESLLKQTGVHASAVDRVFLTGGTSFVPAVESIFSGRFRAGCIVRGEAFTAVAHGLALHAQRMDWDRAQH